MTYKDFITEIIQKAGEITLDLFNDPKVEYTKDTLHQVVTKADLDSQNLIVAAIKNEFPTHGIVAEEENAKYQTEAECIWYIDSLDGTKNFASRVPLWGINIGLAQSGKMICGAVHLPVTQELCFAEVGSGAWLNGKRIHCSEQKEWDYSYGISPIRASQKVVRLFEGIAKISNETAWFSAVGSPAVSALYMADGRRDWYISRGSNVWDYAAPSLIMKEAGCTVTNGKGEEWKIGDKELIVSNSNLHSKLLEIL